MSHPMYSIPFLEQGDATLLQHTRLPPQRNAVCAITNAQLFATRPEIVAPLTMSVHDGPTRPARRLKEEGGERAAAAAKQSGKFRDAQTAEEGRGARECE
jgi:hypothetical protein